MCTHGDVEFLTEKDGFFEAVKKEGKGAEKVETDKFLLDIDGYIHTRIYIHVRGGGGSKLGRRKRENWRGG